MKRCMAGVVLVVAAMIPAAGAQAATTAGQAWPTRPVRLVVGFSPGSATDLSARLLAPKLSEMWGQPVVIESRSGAGSSIANTMVA